MRPFLAGLLAALAASGCGPAAEPSEPESPLTQITQGTAGEDKDPEVSPDGQRLLYASTSFGHRCDLFAKRPGSNVATRLVSAPGDKRFPKINPARPRMLAYCSNARGEWDIYVVEDTEADPDRAVPVSETGTHDLHPTWSPDGRRLAWCSTDDLRRGRWILRIKDLETGRIQSLEDVEGLLPEWSPRDSRIVFQRMKERDRWLSSLWVLDFDGSSARNLTVLFASDAWAAINPAWSPDGKRVVFATAARTPRPGDREEADDLWVADADGSHATRLTASPASDWMPTWASDGRIYFVSNRSGTPRIWSLLPLLPE